MTLAGHSAIPDLPKLNMMDLTAISPFEGDADPERTAGIVLRVYVDEHRFESTSQNSDAGRSSLTDGRSCGAVTGQPASSR